MALKTTWNEDDGIITDYSKTRRVVPVEIMENGNVVDVKYRNVDTVRITKEWVGLTKAAAESEVDDCTQPDGFGDYNYRMSEDTREVGAYMLVREYTVETEGPLTDPDSTEDPEFDPDGYYSSDSADWPKDVTVESDTEGAVIRWALIVDGALGSWSEGDSPVNMSISEPPGSVYIVAMAIRSGMEPSDTITSGEFHSS